MKQAAYFAAGSVQVFNADFLRLEALEAASIELTVTSPPYNVSIDYGEHDDDCAWDGYLDFSKAYLTKLLELTTSGGRLCLNLPLDKNKGGQQSVGADLTCLAKAVGWKYHSTIIWNEGNISRRTAWGSWLSASAPYVIAPVEVVLVLYKDEWKRPAEGRSSGITRDEFLAWTNGVWVFNGESKKRIGHPAPFPIELPRRCIKLFSFESDTVLDPFCGSGSTLLACLETGRKGIGVELEERFCALAKQRTRDALAARLLAGALA